VEWLAVAAQRAHVAVGCLARVELGLPAVGVAVAVLADAVPVVAASAAVVETAVAGSDYLQHGFPGVGCFGGFGCAGAGAVAHNVQHLSGLPDRKFDTPGMDCHIRWGMLDMLGRLC
jgi:hypothetical protein